MCDELKHCEDCGYIFPITKKEALSVCNSLPHMGVFVQRYRRQILAGVAFALKQHGICALHTEIVDANQIACDECWPRDD